MNTRIATSTATLVVFDPSCLRHRLDDTDDWWSVPRQELQEVNSGNALFVGLGSDGVYDLEIRQAEQLPPEGRGIRAFVRNEGGEFYVGPGEDVTAGGLEPPTDSGCRIELAPGSYQIEVRGEDTKLWVTIVPVDAMEENSFADSPSLVTLVRTVRSPGAGQIAPSELVSVLGLPRDAPEVAQLVERLGDTTHVEQEDGSRVIAQGLGLEVLFKHGKLAYVHFYDECEETRTQAAFQRWPFDLPEGLSFGMTRDAALERLGEPLRGGTFFGIYNLEAHGLRVGYSGGALASVNLLWLGSEIMQDG